MSVCMRPLFFAVWWAPMGSGGWEWADGAPLSTCSYTNWAPGQPGNIGGQQCVMLKAAAGFKWDNAGCSQKMYFICQTGPGDTDACGGQSAREVEADADPENAFNAMRSSLLQEEAALSDREADKLRRSESETDFHGLLRLSELRAALEAETEYGPGAMEKLGQISRELGEVWQAEEDPDVDDDQADEIPREFNVVWQSEEDPDIQMWMRMRTRLMKSRERWARLGRSRRLRRMKTPPQL
ncbi:C-type mannose receptor 2-like [Branchiostoma floridae]|uniref:C-type mannose receptor 2-like n=1 Tax=Branchiostoma floridae TaxID=7739 RepID=A0A9J7LBU0_BRAFL|nr:C-type mannose receptor 2-like [Branchiostoma floridae]